MAKLASAFTVVDHSDLLARFALTLAPDRAPKGLLVRMLDTILELGKKKRDEVLSSKECIEAWVCSNVLTVSDSACTPETGTD